MTAPELEDLARGYQHEGKVFEALHAYDRALQLHRRDTNPTPRVELLEWSC